MAQLGLFGKMPSVGDFVSRGFSPVLCESLDRLLQSALVACTADGADAREVMLRARPVMIVVRPGALCATGFSGLWLPSQDRVGRVFPLCVGREVDAQQAQVPLCWPTEALISLVGMAVVRTLESGGGPDELLAACPGKDEWDSAAMQGLPFTTSGDETVPDLSFQGSLFAIQGPEPRMSAASRALCSRMPWVAQALGTIVSPQGKPAWYFATRSLLAWTQFAALFDGRWSHWEWTETPVDAADETLPGFTQAQPPPQHRM